MSDRALAIDPAHRLIVARPRGALDLARCRDLRLDAQDLPAGPPEACFVDLTGVGDIRLDFTQMYELGRLLSAGVCGRRRVRYVVLADTEFRYGMARMFQAVLLEHGVTVTVFRDLADAAQWLGLAPRQLAGSAGG